MQPILTQNIVKELGLDNLPEDKQVEILEKIGQIIFQSVLIRVLTVMNEEDKDEFDKLLSEKANDSDAVLQFLQAKVPELDEIVKDEVVKFKQETLEIMKKVG
jgi:hypothetical protein